MKKRLMMRGTAVLLAGVLAVSGAPVVNADNTYYIYIETAGTVLYKGAGYEYATAGTVKQTGKMNYLGAGLDRNNQLWYNVGTAGTAGAWVPADKVSRYFKSSAVPKTPKAAAVSGDGSGYNDIAEAVYAAGVKYGAVGVQAAVITGTDGEEYDWAWGYSTLASAKMTENTKLSAGAVSETAAAIAAVKLQENGKVSLAGSVNGYWGTKTAQSVSLTMLLTHTSGLRTNFAPYDYAGTKSVLEAAGSYDASVKPGTTSGWRYSPFSIGVAATTLELAAGETLEAYMGREVFGQLGADLSFFPGGLKDTKSLATMYGAGKRTDLTTAEGRAIVASGVIGADQSDMAAGLTGSAGDLAKMYYMLANDGKYGSKQILKAASVAALEKKYFTEKENGGEFRQCIGLRYQTKLYGTAGLYYESGIKNGVQTFASYDPKTKNTVVIMASGAVAQYDSSGICGVCGQIASEIYAVLRDKNRQLYKYPSAKGKALKQGDTIGIVATSYFIPEDAYSKAVNYLKNAGYKVKIAPSVTKHYRFYAGTARQRAQDINDFFKDSTVDAILCLHGGNGAAEVLPYLDYDMIAQHPKLFIGYSDVTALHIALGMKSGITTIHGPMVSSFIATVYRYTSEQFLAGIANSDPIGYITMPTTRKLETVVEGSAQGKIIGGNLTVMASLCGTEYELKADHNILLIEETGEYSSSIERKLRQLEMTGLFNGVDGILIGDLTDCPDSNGITAEEVVRAFAERIGKPTIRRVPCGHSGLNMFLPLGVMTRMTAYSDGSATIRILESAAVK